MLNELEKKEIELLKEIALERKKKGLTQRGLCAIINMSQPSLAKIEQGDMSPQLNTILKILEPLNLTLKIVPKDEE